MSVYIEINSSFRTLPPITQRQNHPDVVQFGSSIVSLASPIPPWGGDFVMYQYVKELSPFIVAEGAVLETAAHLTIYYPCRFAPSFSAFSFLETSEPHGWLGSKNFSFYERTTATAVIIGLEILLYR